MTIIDLLEQYAEKKIDAIEAVRTLTAIVNPDHALDILAIVNQITRVEQGDLNIEDFRSMYK